ncbi:MAG: TonB-dependent receptor [Bacteroidetes bacterium]|nr:TonB-dependent receptor [Bacteroidota bacterium]
MKHLFLSALLCFTASSFSQLTRLEGMIQLDSAASPFGQFIIYSLPDSLLVKGSYVDSTYFQTEFSTESTNHFYVKISLAGYPDTLINFQTSGETVSLGTIIFSGDRTLKTVDVTYKKPEFQRTMDGITVNVQGTTLQTLNTLFDVLIASPKLTSPDGEKIEIIGKGTPLILIDRQPIITVDELRAVPANMVESIQIITNPSAKYKAQGSANGVIEIFTKNFALEGYNMNISTSGGINTQLKPTAGLNGGINIKRKKFSLNGYMGGNYNASNSFGHSEGTTTDDSQRSLISDYRDDNWNSWMYYQVKAAYQLNENQRITSGFRGNSSFGGSETTSDISYAEFAQLETTNSSFSDPTYTWMNNSAFVNYQLETDTNKSNLEINFNMIQKNSSSSGSSLNRYTNYITGQFSEFNIKTESFDKPLVGELRVNYEHNFDTSGWQLRVGFSYSELRNGKIYNRYNRAGSEWIEDTLYTNSYDYKEHIGTIYSELSKSWKKMGFRLGVTGEYTGLDGYSNSLQKQFMDSTYLIPFPSASIMLQPTENVGLTFSYAAGIDRPQFTDYDPFIRYEDSLSISYGNPFLKPSVSHTLSLDMDLFYAYTFSVYVNKTFNPISQISFVNDSSYITASTPWNAKYDQSLGADISIPLQLKWLQGWNSMWISYNQYSFTPEFGRENFANLSYGVYSYLTFILPKDFSIMNQLHVMRWGTSETKSNTQVNWGLRFTKKYKNNDLQFYLDISNIVPPKSKSTDYYGNYIYSSTSQYWFTAFKVGLYYKFGRLKQATQIQESSSGQSGRI